MRMSGFFDASHGSCLLTRRSVTGIILFLNNTPIKWYSKRQATVESSTYSSELVAGRIAVEMIIDFRYRLRMLGVPLIGSTLLFGDNKSMITNVSVPGSVLKKRHNAIAYHRVRECVASHIVDIVHCRSEYNLSDICTKPLGPQVFQRLMHNFGFPPVPADDGEWKTELTNEEQTVCSSHISIVHPWHDRDLVCAFQDTVFVNQVRTYIMREKSRQIEWESYTNRVMNPNPLESTLVLETNED